MLANELLRPFLDYAQHFKPFKSYYIKGLTGTSYALFAQAVYAHLKKNIVYIAKNESTAINLFTDLAALDSKAHVRFFPGYTTSYYAASEPELNTTQERSEVLSSLLHHSHSTIVITYPEALNQLSLQGINLGSVLSVETIKDSAASFVFRQTPGYLSNKLDSLTGMPLINKIRQGQLIDLYLSTTPPPKDSIPSPSIKN